MRLSLYSVSVSLAAITASTNINFVSAINLDQGQFSEENALMLSQLNTEYSNVVDLDDLTNSFSQLASPAGGSNGLLIGGAGVIVGAVIGAGAIAASGAGKSSGEAATVAKPSPTKAPEVTSDSKDEDKDDKKDEDVKKESRSETTAQTRGTNMI